MTEPQRTRGEITATASEANVPSDVAKNHHNGTKISFGWLLIYDTTMKSTNIVLERPFRSGLWTNSVKNRGIANYAFNICSMFIIPTFSRPVNNWASKGDHTHLRTRFSRALKFFLTAGISNGRPNFLFTGVSNIELWTRIPEIYNSYEIFPADRLW